MRISYGVSRIRSGDADLIAVEPSAVGRTGLIICHAAGHVAGTYVAPNNGRPLAWTALQALSAHFPTLVSNQAGDNCGNDNGISSVASSKTYLQTGGTFAPAKSGKVILLGVSMGFTLAANYAMRNPNNVAGIAGIVPLADLDDAYARNPDGTVTGLINTAYGGTYDPVSMGPTRNPLKFAASLPMPIKLWYGTADTTILPKNVSDFVAAAPHATSVPMPGLGHDTEGAYPLALGSGLIDFLESVA